MTEVLLVCAWASREAGRSTVVRAFPDPLAGLGDRVIHPPDANLRSFGFRREGLAELVVADRRQVAAFDSPGQNNVIFFRVPPDADVLVVRASAGPVVYRRAPASWFEHAGHQPAAGTGALFLQSARNVTGRHRTFEVHVGPLNGGADSWMNPVVVRLDAAGTDLRGVEGGQRELADPESALIVEPYLDPAQRARFAAAGELARATPARATLLGTLLRSAEDGDPADATSARLDVLGGRFQVLSPAAGPAQFRWCPAAPGKNAGWVGQRWAARWGGEVFEHSSSWFPVPPAALRSDRPRSHTTWVTRAEYDDATRSAGALLEEVDLPPTDPLSPAMRFLRGLAASIQDLPPARHRAFVRIGDGSLGVGLRRGDLAFPARIELLPLLDRLAREWVLPRSPIQVGFPQSPEFHAPHPATREARARTYERATRAVCLDPLRSLNWGGWRTLTVALAEASTIEAAEIRLRDGWWSRWGRWVLGAAPSSTCRLRVDGEGFVLGRSRLGRDRLGWRPSPFLTPSFLRF